MIDLTLCIPLSGRTACWPRMAAFLQEQRSPRERCRLYLLDTSGDDKFNIMLQYWKADYGHQYGDVVIERKRFHDASTNIADAPRDRHFAKVNTVMVQIYDHLRKQAVGKHTLVIEDDVIPPLDAYPRLQASLVDRVFSVSGAYPIRNSWAWTAWRSLQACNSMTPGLGVELVQATGFGCLLMRTSDFQQATLDWEARTQQADWPWGYDMQFFAHVHRSGRLVLVDWDVRCDHLNSQGQPWTP